MSFSLNVKTPLLETLCLNCPVWYEDRLGNICYAEYVSEDDMPIRDDDEAYETIPAATVWAGDTPLKSETEDTLKRVFVDYKDPDNPPPKEVLAEG